MTFLKRTSSLYVSVLTLLVLAAALWSGTQAENDVPADRTTGTLTGTVTDATTGDVIPGAAVLIYDIGYNDLTDDEGAFRIRNVPAGTYTVKVTAYRYQPATRRSVQITAGKTTTLSISLSPTSPGPVVEGEVRLGETRNSVKSSRDLSGSHVLASPAASRQMAPQGNWQRQLPPGYNTEDYDAIEENTFRAARAHPLSTFSIDVDAASYTNIRRFIQGQQQTPPKDAVRIEEMVNYFVYDYPEPDGDDPFAVYTEVGPTPWNSAHQLVHIGLQGERLPESERPASNLVFLLDVSGSMD
ncbi:MAG: hypothetical protein GVY18_18615, partial [Bacteroidetes bacterium]|nr:hypothetical protein [Bacteroidota bacterium]